MKNLEIQVIQECVQQSKILVADFISKYETELSTLKQSMAQINHELNTRLKIEGGNIYVSEQDRDKCYRYLKYNKIKILAYYDAENRQELLFLQLVLSDLDLNLQELADQLLVSKNTALADIKRLKNELKENDIYIKYSRKNGYTILGSEFAIRNDMIHVLRSLLRKPVGRYLLIETGFVQENEILLIKNRLLQAQEKAQVTFTEESMEELPILLNLLMKRSWRCGLSWHFPFEKYDIKNTKEYPIYQDIFRGFESLNDNDLLYMVLQILSVTFVETNIGIYASAEIHEAIDQFISFLEDECVMQFSDPEQLREKLLLHLRPAIFRCLLSVNIRNPLTQVIQKDYRILYSKIKEGVAIIESVVSCTFPPEEVAFIAMIVISSMKEVQQDSHEKTFTAIVLCRSGMSISKLLLENLKSLFPAIEFIGAYAIHDVAKSSIQPDFIFTTIPIHTDTTTFLVPSVMDKAAKNQIKHQVDLAINQDVKKKTKQLFRYLDDLFPEGYKENAIERIEQFYQLDQEGMTVQENYFQLQKENFSIIDVENWQEAFYFAFGKLQDRGSVNTHYIEKTFEIFQQDYPYMMIGEECYLPHAKPDNGVLRPDYQFVLIKDKLELPNKEKMQMMIALAPSKKNQHVEWLLNLNNTLLVEGTMKKIAGIKQPTELYQLMMESFKTINAN